MTALDVIAAVGGLCGAVALAWRCSDLWQGQFRAYQDLRRSLEQWGELSPEEQAAARRDLASEDEDRRLNEDAVDPWTVLDEVRFTARLMERRPLPGFGLAAWLKDRSAASDRPWMSRAAVRRAAREVLRGTSDA